MRLVPRNAMPGFKLALIAFILSIVVVMLGAFTRLVDAGLGCPDWPGCYGHLTWPDEAHEIERALELFPHAPVETDKTWPEMVHRYFAGSLGILIAVIAFRSWGRREQQDYPFRLPILIAFIVVWQALFGMWTVTLKLWPQVVTIHLLGGMTILSLLWLLVNRLSAIRWRFNQSCYNKLSPLRSWLVVGIILVVVQILLGGWTTSNYAQYGCPDFPTCHGEWWPPMDAVAGFNIFQTIGPNYLGGQLENDARVAIHFVHRLGALILTVYLVIMALRLFAAGDSRVARLTWLVLGALTLQIFLGISNVYFLVPLEIAVAHNAGAALLLLTLITLATRLWMARMEEETS